MIGSAPAPSGIAATSASAMQTRRIDPCPPSTSQGAYAQRFRSANRTREMGVISSRHSNASYFLTHLNGSDFLTHFPFVPARFALPLPEGCSRARVQISDQMGSNEEVQEPTRTRERLSHASVFRTLVFARRASSGVSAFATARQHATRAAAPPSDPRGRPVRPADSRRRAQQRSRSARRRRASRSGWRHPSL